MEISKQIVDYIEEMKNIGRWYDHTCEQHLSKRIEYLNLGYLGFNASDLDFVFYSTKSKKLLMFDHKIHNGDLKPSQKIIFKLFDKVLKEQNEFHYLGFFTLVFENTWFDDGKAYLKKQFSKELEIIEFTTWEEFRNYCKNLF